MKNLWNYEKKLWVTLSILPFTLMPIFTIVSCGVPNSTNSYNDYLVKENVEKMIEWVSPIKKTLFNFNHFDEETDLINNYDLKFLGLISEKLIPNQDKLYLKLLNKYFVVNQNINDQTVRIQISVFSFSIDFQNFWFGDIKEIVLTEFAQKFNLAMVPDLIFYPSTLNNFLIFNNPKQVSKTDLIDQLTLGLEKYFTNQSPFLFEYTMTELTKWNGTDYTPIPDTLNLFSQPTRYQTVITALPQSEYMQGNVVLTVDIPRLNQYNLANLPNELKLDQEDFMSLNNPAIVDLAKLSNLLTKIIIQKLKYQKSSIDENDFIIRFNQTNGGFLNQTNDLTQGSTIIKASLYETGTNDKIIGQKKINLIIPKLSL